MKAFILFSVLFYLAGSAAAQSQQQPDSLPQGPGWHVIYRDTTLGFVSISFPTPDTGFVLGQDPITLRKVTLRTTDSGNTWSELTTSPNGNRVLFLTSSIGYILAGRTMHKTTNGGASWTPHGIGTQGFQNSMVFPTKDTGFVAGAGNVSRTTDGGETWQAYNNSLGGCNVVSFSDHWNGFVGGQSGISPADSGRPHAANFARTTDGGTTWIPTYSHLTSDIQSIIAQRPHTLVVGLANGVLARSTDNGWTWDMSNVVTGKGDVIGSISFADTLHGLAVASGLVGYSSDGGIHWITQPVRTSGYLFDGQLLSNGTAYLVSDGGLIHANRAVAEMNVLPPPLMRLSVQVFPNPASSEIQFTYNIPQPEHVTFRIFSTSGILISTIAQALLQSGSQHMVLSTSALSSGGYLYQMSSEDYQASGNFTVIK